MSRTTELATRLMDWFKSLPEAALIHAWSHQEAVNGVSELDPIEAIHRIAKNCSVALQLVTQGKSYLVVEPGWGSQYIVYEYHHVVGNKYDRINAVPCNNAFDAMINLKNRHEALYG